MADKASSTSNVVGKPKQGSERSSEANKQKSSSKTDTTASSSKSKKTQDAEVVDILQCMRQEMQKQTTRMVEQEKLISDQTQTINDVTNRIQALEESQGYYAHEYADEQNQYEDNTEYDPDEGSGDPENTPSLKRKLDANNNSRFQSMNKKYKISEKCDVPIDSVLAENVTELFRCGIDKQKYEELIKDVKHSRPENCEGLVVVRTDEMIWKSLTPFSRTTDDKLQDIEEPVVKAAVVLSKVVNKMASMESDLENSLFGELIEDCNDSLALLGHANTLINMTRKDFLKPELNQEYKHLCSHNRPFTKTLFGDDLPKSAKELEDCSKISYKMFTGRPMRGSTRSRPMGRGVRYRGTGRGQRGRGASAGYGPGPGYRGAKNVHGRGMPRQYKY